MKVRPPRHPALRSVVQTLWASEPVPAHAGGTTLEQVLPTGGMHVVFRLSGGPLRLLQAPDDATGWLCGRAVVGGARTTAYLRDVGEPVHSVGVQLLPGAASLLFGPIAGELAERHTPLEDLWGAFAARAEEQLHAAPTAEERLQRVEALLVERLVHPGPHAAVLPSLRALAHGAAVRDAVDASGLSHRHFIDVFRRAVGLTPKAFCRVQRFQSAVGRLHTGAAANLIDVALNAGYSDQAHFTREFTAMAGLSPGRYRTLSPRNANHVSLVK